MTRPLANLEVSHGDFDAVNSALRGSPRGRAFLAEFEQRIRNGGPQPAPAASSIPPAEFPELRRIAYGLQDASATITATLQREPIMERMSLVAEEAQDIAWTFREREGDRTLWARLDGLAGELVAATGSLQRCEIRSVIESLGMLITALLRLTDVIDGSPHPIAPAAEPVELEIARVAAGLRPAAAIRAETEGEVDVRKLDAADALLLFS